MGWRDVCVFWEKKEEGGGLKETAGNCFAVEEEGELLRGGGRVQESGKRVVRNGEAGVVPQRR